jgi:hypothetical protein
MTPHAKTRTLERQSHSAAPATAALRSKESGVADQRPSAAAQRQLAQLIAQSPAMASQRKMVELVSGGSRMATQRVQLAAIGGQGAKPIQLMGGYIPGANGPYANLGNNVATAGNAFSDNVRNAVLNANSNNLGNTVNAPQTDDQTGNALVRTYSRIAAIDHIYPAGIGGMNCYRNAQVIDQATNAGIGNTYPKHGYNGARMYMGHAVTAHVPNEVDGMNEPEDVNIAQGTIFDIEGSGANAEIDMSGTLDGQRDDPDEVTPQQARNWGILGAASNPR